jgi:hypothetical protein
MDVWGFCLGRLEFCNVGWCAGTVGVWRTKRERRAFCFHGYRDVCLYIVSGRLHTHLAGQWNPENGIAIEQVTTLRT